MKDIKIYTKEHCPFCHKVKNYLKSEGLEFEDISVDGKPDLYNEIKKQTNHNTVPQVFIEGKFIGGCDDFFNYIKK